MTIRHKGTFVSLWNAGRFDNKLKTWTDWKGIPRGFPSRIMCRSMEPGKQTCETTAREIHRNPKLQTGYHYNECAPDEACTLQGELWWNGQWIFWGAVKSGKRMRQMLAEDATFTTGWAVEWLLRGYLSPDSYDDLMEIVDAYPGHIIEFTAYSRDLGDRKGRNTLVWEVRLY